METKELNIYQKLAKIKKPVEVLKKNRKGYGYNYVDEEVILSKITGLMEKYGVSLIPSIVPSSTQVTPYQYTKTKATKDGKVYEENVNEIIVQADTEWSWVNNDNPTDRIVVPWAMVGQQTDASQSLGSGLTYSSRYFLLKYFQVATLDDDPDNWRSRQREAEAEADKVVADGIVEQIHKFVTAHLESAPDDKQKIITVTKKFVKENGRASANYYAIEDSATAVALFEALKSEFSE